MRAQIDHHSPTPIVQSTGNIGSDIRALHQSRAWTLNYLAEQLGRLVG